MLNFKSQRNNKNDKLGSVSQNPKILDVDLIRGEMPARFDLKRHAGTLFFALIIAALFIAEVYLGLDWWSNYETNRLEQSKKRADVISEEIRQMQNASDQISSFKERVNLADTLLSSHIYWTNFFTWLESNTLSSVLYEGFSGKNDGEYELAATTKAFRDISWQTRLLLADPNVLSVSIDSGSDAKDPEKPDTGQEIGDISFSIKLKVDPKIFKINSLDE